MLHVTTIQCWVLCSIHLLFSLYDADEMFGIVDFHLWKPKYGKMLRTKEQLRLFINH